MVKVKIHRWEFREVKEPSFLMPFAKLKWDWIKTAKRFVDFFSDFEEMVVVGMGGSSLGTKTIHQFLKFKAKRKVFFIDNVDPLLVGSVLRRISWKTTCFAFVSKSGKTLETVTIFNIILKELEKRRLKAGKRIILIGDEGNAFCTLAREQNLQFAPIPQEIGGRFSVFTFVGIIPSLFAGYSVERLYSGAEKALNEKQLAYNIAEWKFYHYRHGRRISVMMPYSSFLSEFTEWYSQLWGESLGKEKKGQTPLRAVGTVSQHSTLQLFMDGPDDKLFQFIFVKNFPFDFSLPQNAKILSFLGEKTLTQVLEAEYIGTVTALLSRGRPVLEITASRVCEETLGFLFMTYMLAVVKMGELLGVNPYGQPAVEVGKKTAREILIGGKK
jgi:glucose-6-phosphate isomerase